MWEAATAGAARRPSTPAPGAGQGLTVTKIAVPGTSAPRSGLQPPHTWVLDAGHSGSTRSTSARPGRGQLAHPVAEGAVVLDVQRLPLGVLLDVRRAVEVGAAHGQARPRPGRRAATTGTGASSRRRTGRPARRTRAHSRIRAAESATNGTAPYAVKTTSKLESAKGSAVASHWASGAVNPVAWVNLWLSLSPSRSIPRDRSVATTCAPRVAAHRLHWPAPAPTSRTRRPVEVAEQAGVGLPQALGSPDEVLVTEEGAVLGVVLRGLVVPPRAVGAHGLTLLGVPSCHLCEGPAVVGHTGILPCRAARRRAPADPVDRL